MLKCAEQCAEQYDATTTTQLGVAFRVTTQDAESDLPQNWRLLLWSLYASYPHSRFSLPEKVHCWRAHVEDLFLHEYSKSKVQIHLYKH